MCIAQRLTEASTNAAMIKKNIYLCDEERMQEDYVDISKHAVIRVGKHQIKRRSSSSDVHNTQRSASSMSKIVDNATIGIRQCVSSTTHTYTHTQFVACNVPHQIPNMCFGLNGQAIPLHSSPKTTTSVFVSLLHSVVIHPPMCVIYTNA